MTIVSFIDLETTGKLSPDHRIIELSLRCCELETQRELCHYLERYNPERNIDKIAFNIHGISLEELKGEETFNDKIWNLEHKLLNTDILCAHNLIGFDLPMLEFEFKRCEREFPTKPKRFDTLQGTFATDLGKSPNLQELCFALDIEYDPELAHSAGYDTACLRDAFFNGFKWGWFKL